MGSLCGQTPPVKTLHSIGSGGVNQTVFSQMAMTRKTRLIFINSILEVARIYGFDGVDLDWEFPATAEDTMNLAILYKEWRKALHDESKACRKPRLLLTSAYYASTRMSNGVSISYPIGTIREYVDWVSPMYYDYRGIWENLTGEHSALYDSNSNPCTNYGIGSWIQAVVAPQKLVMGLPAHGHLWKLQDQNVTGIGAPATGPGLGGELGIPPYDDIVDFNRENNVTVKFDGETVPYYSYAGEYRFGTGLSQSAVI
ncbi:hypothetical protein SLEP1_g15536 [Rubroshorea leprosula]|uniref:GH18 domain-containing protein n=1 Tax=Rubroshorea leprosula TaxID=152421 RepID=A0AAV5IX29_9ROSI|nr:hypothetical protein SLEP1_g15536 [Rubroshorea leprosula]